jgi:hypothetical protein
MVQVHKNGGPLFLLYFLVSLCCERRLFNAACQARPRRWSLGRMKGTTRAQSPRIPVGSNLFAKEDGASTL